ncbi:hypothetical protein TWF696_005806 [Orbilia brochopaga]|uniref:Uncharacterized protein n=1 Tax=Orbilia brochopaga TaxID=3140254 RepID=A0AAV9UXM0_9PEZI
MINTRKMRYTPDAMAAFKAVPIEVDASPQIVKAPAKASPGLPFAYLKQLYEYFLGTGTNTTNPKHRTASNTILQANRSIGEYPLTSALSQWVKDSIESYEPDKATSKLVGPFCKDFLDIVDKERAASSGLHDIDLIQFTYKVTLEVAAAVLLAADATEDPIEIEAELHSSRAGADDQFTPWGTLLTGLDCQPPIIALFPFYLMMCQAFTFKPSPAREDYVYAALTGVDWAKGKNQYSEKFARFEARARAAVPTLDDKASGQDRSYWRIALAYLSALQGCENSRTFRTPQGAAIRHDLDPDLVIAMRALDTIGTAYMCDDGAAFLDTAGFDSLIGTALVNDIMDLHTDIKTGETRNFLRLLYPMSFDINQAMKAASIMLSGMLCEVYRGHRRARFDNREDGRISATSPPYSFSRARHRRVFETLEKYIAKYPDFWDWTWEIFSMAKEQVTEAGLKETLGDAIKRAGKQEDLPPSPGTKFFNDYYKLVESTELLGDKSPLGVDANMSQIVRDIHNLWHGQLLDCNKKPGWGPQFDIKSDKLLGDAGRILLENPSQDSMYKFAIAYGRLSMSLPYVAYHTVDAIILAFGIVG